MAQYNPTQNTYDPNQYSTQPVARPTQTQNQYNTNVGQDMYAQQPRSYASAAQQPAQNPYAGQQQRPTYGQQARGGGAQPTRPYQPDPLPGQEASKNPGPYYNPQYPQYQQGPGPATATANEFGYYQGLDPTTLQSNDEREAALQSVQANVPIWQLEQNAYQYAQDANEANRRWQEQFGYQQGLDTFNQQLSTQQQQMAEWQAQQAAQQWAQDFGRQTGLDQYNQQFAQQQFGLQDYATREGLGQSQQQLNQSQQQIQNTAAYQQGQLGNEATQIAYNAQYQQGQIGLQQRANEITQAYNEGRLSNEQRAAALAELTQQQSYGLQTQQLSTQQQELARRYGLDLQTQEQLNAYRNSQMAQEAALAREQMAAQQQMAIMQAYGRNAAPNVKWMGNV